MRVQRPGRPGTRTEHYAETYCLFRDVLGIRPEHGEPDFALLALPAADHDYVEIIGPARQTPTSRRPTTGLAL